MQKLLPDANAKLVDHQQMQQYKSFVYKLQSSSACTEDTKSVVMFICEASVMDKKSFQYRLNTQTTLLQQI